MPRYDKRDRTKRVQFKTGIGPRKPVTQAQEMADIRLSANGYSYPQAVARCKSGLKLDKPVSSATLKKLLKNGWLKVVRESVVSVFGSHIRRSRYEPGDGPAKRDRRVERKPRTQIRRNVGA